MSMKWFDKLGGGWFLAFVGVFSVLAAYVFWGTWSPDVSPIMPDCVTTPTTDYGVLIHNWWCSVVSSGKMLPTDLLWSGLLVPPYYGNELRYVVAVFVAGLALAYFLRGRGLSHPASYGAGLLLAFCGYWLTLFSAGHGGWFLWMTYGVFAFGLADRAVRQGRLRHWLLLGLTVSWAGFQQQDIWLFFTVFTTVYFFWCCVRERKFPWRGMLVALTAFVLIGLPNFRDTLHHTVKDRAEQISRNENVTNKTASEADKQWEFVTNWSMPPEDTLEFFIPRVHGDTSCPFVLSLNRAKGAKMYTGALGRPLNANRGNYRQHSLYVGLVTCLLALVAVLTVFFKKDDGGSGNRRETIFFLLAALVFYSLSLGRYCEPVYRLIFALPAGNLIRCPVKWHHLTEFCLVVLAGFGIESLLRTRFLTEGWARRFRAGLWIVCLVVLAGAINLASVAKLYCAPVNVRAARQSNSNMQLTVLSRQQLQNQQIANQVRAGRIVSLANWLGDSNHYLVGVVNPHGGKAEFKPSATAILLGVTSLLASLAVMILAVFRRTTVVV